MPETIEAEVLEIDGSPPPPPREAEPEPAWKSFPGKVFRLDRRWWPLWLLLGIVVFAFVAVFSLVFGAVMLVAKTVGAILRFLFGGSTPRGGGGLARPVR